MKIKLAILFSLLAFCLKAQDPNERGNLANYYDKTINFGFLIGINNSTFNIDPAVHFERFDSLKTIKTIPQTGFNLGIVTDLRLHKYITLRFVPNIAFSERHIEYLIEGIERTVYIKKIESTFLNFPLNLRLRSKRVRNFGMYILAGGAYNLDLAGKKGPGEVPKNLINQEVRIKRNDLSYEVGLGTEFYMMYFKFGIEAKLSLGTKDLLINENTLFSNSINKINSKVFLISFTFEG